MDKNGTDGHQRQVFRDGDQVIAGEEMSRKFKTTSGVRQGCRRSPVLFNIYMNDLEETLRKRTEEAQGAAEVQVSEFSHCSTPVRRNNWSTRFGGRQREQK